MGTMETNGSARLERPPAPPEGDLAVEVRACCKIDAHALPQPASPMPSAGPGPFELLSARRLIALTPLITYFPGIS